MRQKAPTNPNLSLRSELVMDFVLFFRVRRVFGIDSCILLLTSLTFSSKSKWETNIVLHVNFLFHLFLSWVWHHSRLMALFGSFQSPCQPLRGSEWVPGLRKQKQPNLRWLNLYWVAYDFLLRFFTLLHVRDINTIIIITASDWMRFFLSSSCWLNISMGIRTRWR